MQIFMQSRGNDVLHRGPYGMRSESGAYPFAKTGRAAAIISRMTGHLSDSCSCHHAAYRLFPDHRMFPVLPIGMRLAGLRHRSVRSCERNGQKDELCDSPHTNTVAIGGPKARIYQIIKRLWGRLPLEADPQIKLDVPLIVVSP